MKLTLHVGLGKTGTSAVQNFLDRESATLKAAKIKNTGINLQHLARKYRMSSQGEINDNDALRVGLQGIEAAGKRLGSSGHIIWSNEALTMSHNLATITDTIAEFTLTSKVIDEVEVVLVLRRQDEWLESAYRQWALKHKTYNRRRILTIEEYKKSTSHLLNYETLYDQWSKLGDTAVTVVDYHTLRDTGGIVRYFADHMGLSWNDKFDDYGNVHGSLGPALSHLVASYNSGFYGEVFPERFSRVINEAQLPEISAKGSVFVGGPLRAALIDEYQASNTSLSQKAFGDDRLFSTASLKEGPLYSSGPRDTVKYLWMLAKKQQDEISLLKAEQDDILDRLNRLERR
jgi:hypothetical protein